MASIASETNDQKIRYVIDAINLIYQGEKSKFNFNKTWEYVWKFVVDDNADKLYNEVITTIEEYCRKLLINICSIDDSIKQVIKLIELWENYIGCTYFINLPISWLNKVWCVKHKKATISTISISLFKQIILKNQQIKVNLLCFMHKKGDSQKTKIINKINNILILSNIKNYLRDDILVSKNNTIKDIPLKEDEYYEYLKSYYPIYNKKDRQFPIFKRFIKVWKEKVYAPGGALMKKAQDEFNE